MTCRLHFSLRINMITNYLSILNVTDEEEL